MCVALISVSEFVLTLVFCQFIIHITTPVLVVL